jgi:hypothetical protein
MKAEVVCILTTLVASTAAFPAVGQENFPVHVVRTHPSIPWDALGASAGRQCHGDALAVTATSSGVILHCAFQRLDGHATAEGLWLTSTTANSHDERFRIVASSIGRMAQPGTILSPTGHVYSAGSLARWERPGLTEEYSVSVDGLQQDFVIPSPPRGERELFVTLALSGAQAEAAAYGAKLTLADSGRALAYSRLRAVDAKGKALPVKIKVISATYLAVYVDDTGASYPVRIDPTFSDANWVSLGGLPGVDPGGVIDALVVDQNAGLIYIGGQFDAVGTIIVNSVAEWTGTSWSVLGQGVSGGGILALAVDGTGNLYAGGTFTNAGSVAVNYIAKWNGSTWSALGAGIGGGDDFGHGVSAMVFDADYSHNLYVGGDFTTAGGVAANYIAAWNGTTWLPLGSGMNEPVDALAVDGYGDLYAGGIFSRAGGSTVNYIATWDGFEWYAMGLGMNQYVTTLTVDVDGNVYAGGPFTSAGGVTANHIAKWDGIEWLALGSGVNGTVVALAADDTGKLYVGGVFTMAGNVAANYVAKWDGIAWSALGSGANGNILALAVDRTGNLYAGGSFTAAGNVAADEIAKGTAPRGRLWVRELAAAFPWYPRWPRTVQAISTPEVHLP